jgi:hypothetical protein
LCDAERDDVVGIHRCPISSGSSYGVAYFYRSDQLVPWTVLLQRRRWSRNWWWRLEQTGEKSPLNGGGGDDFFDEGNWRVGLHGNNGWLELFVVAGGGDGGTDGAFFD